MNHIYFTALVNGAGLAAALARGDGRERVYIVEPTGALRMTRMLQTKNFQAIRHAHIAPKHH
jgi:rifampin ADP-ribosylating transferase